MVVRSGKRQYLVRTIGRFDSIDELERMILARRGDSVIRLDDVASVRLDHFEKMAAASYNGKPNLFIAIRKEAGSNVITIKEEMIGELETLNSDVLASAGLQIELVASDVTYVQESVKNVWQNLILGSVLAIGVMFLFLRSVRAAAVGVMGIPICIIVALFGLLITGRTINVISLAGIAFAIGMTLDNSIVVLESIALERRRGANRWRAALQGVKSVWPAVFASTMTTVLVFLPVAFIEQEAGQLYSDIAIAISFAIMASMLVAITVLPTAAARLQLESEPAESRRQGAALQASRLGGRLRQRTLTTVHWLISTRRRQLACIGTTTLLSIAIIVGLTPPGGILARG